MKIPTINRPIVVNILIIFFTAFISWFTLLYGGAHLFEAFTHPNPNIPITESLAGLLFSILLCAIGVASFLTMIAAIKGIYKKRKRVDE